MKAILFGGTGMIGQGVLLELLRRAEVTEIISVGRTPVEQSDRRLTQLIIKDLTDYSSAGEAFTGVDAVFFCLGVSSAGMSEDQYRQLSFTIPLAAATAIHAKSPQAVFTFISGAGTDSSEKGRTMWARVKGQAENALQKVGFKAVYCFRPGYIQPMDGIESKTASYRRMYVVTRPFWPLIKKFKTVATSTQQLGLAMVNVAQRGWKSPILESADINEVK